MAKKIGFLEALRIATTPPPRRNDNPAIFTGSKYGARVTVYAASRGGASYQKRG